MISKLILGIITIILAFIGIFPIVNGNPIFLILWLIGILFVIGIWIYELLKKWGNALIINPLKDDDFRHEIFMGFIHERKSIMEITDDNIVVSKIFEKSDLLDFLKFYLYLHIKKSKISVFNSKFILNDEVFEIIENDAKGIHQEDVRYSQIYPLKGKWEMWELILDNEYDGKIKFKNLMNLDKKPDRSIPKLMLFHVIEKELEGDSIKNILNKLLQDAEQRGIIKSINTESIRSFGNLFYICYRAGDPPEKDPFSISNISGDFS